MSKQSKKSNKKNNKIIKPEAARNLPKAQKSLGQNFLIDEDVIYEIVQGSDVDKDCLVIEIGPGTGVLTCPLAEEAGRLVAIELDEKLIEPLRVKTFSYGNVEIIHGDILEVDLDEIIERYKKEYGLSTVRVVGNLPYYITTPIIMKLLEMRTMADSITAMMQKEVGDRIAATPGSKNAGVITYAVHYYSEVRKIVDAKSECFYPAPKVDSVVLRLDIRKEPAVKVDDEGFYFKVIKAGFMQRRKTIHNSLMTLGGYSKEQITAALEKAEIDSNRRAESLTMEDFNRLTKALQEEK